MKFTAFFLLVACLQVSAKTDAQLVTLKEKNVPLEKIFSEIRKQTGFEFIAPMQLVSSAPKITVKVENVTVQEALNECLKGLALTYEIEGNTIIVKQAVDLKSTATPPNASITTEPPPPIDITGRITNAQGEPLAGANIIIKRTGRGTIADANGNFKLNNVNNDDIITISFIGYKTLNIKVGERNNFTLIMDLAVDKLDQVVVQAYGKTTDRIRTGNIGRITSDDISKQPVMNPLKALQGQIAGTVVSNTTGYASGSVKVEIRGRNTINPNFPSDPLYIIDGVPLTILDIVPGAASYDQGSQGMVQSGIPSPANGQSPLFNINPADIESIEVLKDADATALYGSRASNGVILITTKKGKVGKTHADFSVYTGYSEVPKYYPMLNTKQYVQIRKEALANDGLPMDINNAPDLVVWDTTRYTNWQKYLWGRTGRIVNANTSLSGGDARTNFRASAGYTYQREITTLSGGNTRGSLSLNLNHRSINQKFNLSWSSFYTFSNINLINLPDASVFLPPNAPAVFDSRGNLNYAGWEPLSDRFIFGGLLQTYDAKSNLLNSNISVGYEIIKGLNAKVDIGYNNSVSTQLFKTPISSQNPSYNPKGSLQYGITNFHNLIIEPQIDYSRFINKGKLAFTIGGTVQENRTDGILTVGDNFSNDALLTSVTNAPTKSVFQFGGEYKYSGVFARLNYDWKNKYILNFNARRDGSSRFGPGRQFGNFGSIGAAWLFSEEGWMKQFSFLSFGKLRASYGTTGGDQVGNYGYISLWQSNANSGLYNGYNPINPSGFSDSLLQWQVNKKLEASLTLGFLKERITLEASWYRNRCNNQLVSFPTPYFTGFNQVTSNSPANVQNSGLEFLINGNLIDSKDFKWQSKVNIGFNRNKLLDYPNFSQSPYKNTFVIGKPLNIRKYLHFTGVDPQTGDYTFEDRNKDGSIVRNPGDLDDRFVYDLTPKYTGGFTNTFSYKNWSLSLFFYFKKQKGFNALTVISDIPGSISNHSTAILNHWQNPGDVVPIGRLTTLGTDNIYNYFYFSDANLTDASFIRLQNASLAYELPKVIKKKAGFESCRIYIQAENLFLITKYKGIDPDIQNFGGLPSPRIITVGLSCNL